MIEDAFSLPDGAQLDTDVCIIGAGAAGITIAREVAGTGMTVLVAESGGFAPDRDTEALNRGTVGGPYSLPLDESRARYFGGTTNLWSGWCRELDPLDFERRAWVPESGWPFGYETLVTFYDRARTICEVDDSSIASRSGPGPAKPELPLPSGRLRTVRFRLSPPTAFGETYRGELARAPNVTVLLHANASRIESSADRARIDRVLFRTLRGRTFHIRAKFFVLATGGIENARLLLASSTDPHHAPGNQHDLVGRFYMDHPAFFSGEFSPSKDCPPLALYTTPHVRRPAVAGPLTAALALSPQLLAAEGLLNSVARFVPQPAYGMSPSWESEGVASAKRLRKSAARMRNDGGILLHGRRAATGFPTVAATLFRIAMHRVRPQWRVALRCFVEPQPDRESRVTLSGKRSSLGDQLPHAVWLTGEAERRAVIHLHEILESELARFGIVTTVIKSVSDDWPNSQVGASHHMGTTRMHTSPLHGVVDADCRVHGTGNLFVAGSSVFPTCGYANPTLTIVALACRLADRLKAQFAV